MQEEDRDSAESPTLSNPTMSASRGWWIVILLFLLNLVNYIDRSQLYILAEPIRRDLGLSDSQIGLLQGFAFAFVYAVLALPLARIADTGRHRAVLIGSVAIWSVMTMVSGFAQSFWQLAAMRVGVALGEAGLHPTSHSLISGALPLRRRGKALAIFALGLPVGIAAGAFLGGRIADAASWRVAFQILGPIGFLLLPLILIIVPVHSPSRSMPARASLTGTMRILWRNRNFRFLFCAYGCATTYGYGLAAFLAPFLMRDHGLSASAAGVVVGLANGLVGGIGLFAGGLLFDRIHHRTPGRGLHPTAFALAISTIVGPVGFLVGSWLLSALFITGSMFLYLFIIVPTISMSQLIAPPSMRATASASITLSGSLIGATIGPLLTGLLSDAFLAQGYPHSLAYALCVMALFQLFGMLFYFGAGGAIEPIDGPSERH